MKSNQANSKVSRMLKFILSQHFRFKMKVYFMKQHQFENWFHGEILIKHLSDSC